MFNDTLVLDPETANQVLQTLLFGLAVLLALTGGFFALAFAATGLDKLKGDVKTLLGKKDVGKLLDAIGDAPAKLQPLLGLMDEPDDALILLVARAMRQDPALLVKRVEQVATIFVQLALILPELKDALGLTEMDTPPKPAEAESSVGTAQ